MSNLLNFEKLRNALESNETVGKVYVYFYTVNKDKEIVLLTSPTTSANAFLKSKNATGNSGEIFEYMGNLMVGVGKLNDNTNKVTYKELDAMNIQKSMGALYNYVSKYYKQYEIHFNAFELIKYCYFGFILASYSYNFLLKDKKEDFTCKLVYDEKNKEINEAVEMAHAQNIARFLGDTPANLMTPTLFCEYAKKIFSCAEANKVKLTVVEEEKLRELKMNMMLSVGEGSAEKSKLLTLELNNADVDVHQIAMVGKGVTFDSGGISLKPGLNMHHMKFDMMGAATMLSTFYCCARLNIKINMTCTLPLVENMPGSKATKPGDVVTAMNGLSVEINNTDAEGRLILGDALTYAQTQYKNKPTILMDAATLTGAMVVALGNVYAGYFTNSEELSKNIAEATLETSELLWRMPVSDYYKNMMKSNVADLCNIGRRGLGGACSAADFLRSFVEEEQQWVHFDIAGLMNESFLKEVYKSGGTGRPLSALVQLVKKYI